MKSKKSNKKPLLAVITGYSGAGKTTLSFELGKKHDFIVLSEDNFVFDMSPFSMNFRVDSNENRQFGMEAIVAALKAFMKSKKDVIVEGALVDGPLFPRDFKKIAKENGYDFCQITMIADRRCRVRRKKRKKGHVVSDELDRRLRTAADDLGYLSDGVVVMNNTGKKFEDSIKEFEGILGLSC